MKKFLFIFLLISILFTACVPVAATETKDFIEVPSSGNNITIIVDSITGVEYILYKDDWRGGFSWSGLCPRYNADGTLFNANQEE